MRPGHVLPGITPGPDRFSNLKTLTGEGFLGFIRFEALSSGRFGSFRLDCGIGLFLAISSHVIQDFILAGRFRASDHAFGAIVVLKADQGNKGADDDGEGDSEEYIARALVLGIEDHIHSACRNDAGYE